MLHKLYFWEISFSLACAGCRLPLLLTTFPPLSCSPLAFSLMRDSEISPGLPLEDLSLLHNFLLLLGCNTVSLERHAAVVPCSAFDSLPSYSSSSASFVLPSVISCMVPPQQEQKQCRFLKNLDNLSGQSDMVLHNEQKLMSLLIYIIIIIIIISILMIILKSANRVLGHDMVIPLVLHLGDHHIFLDGISFVGTAVVA